MCSCSATELPADCHSSRTPKVVLASCCFCCSCDLSVAAGNVLQLLLQMTMAAMVTSLDPTINRGQTSGTDSHQLQALQFWLLDCIWRQCPQALYPAALDAYADLHEVGPAQYDMVLLAWAGLLADQGCCKEVLQHAICSWWAQPWLFFSWCHA